MDNAYDSVECSICKKQVKRICSCITCSVCHQWTHISCNNITRINLRKSEYPTFVCIICKEAKELLRFKEMQMKMVQRNESREVLVKKAKLNKENDCPNTSVVKRNVLKGSKFYKEYLWQESDSGSKQSENFTINNNCILDLEHCGICKKKINRYCTCITCSVCHQWTHISCNNIIRINLGKSEYPTFVCIICKEARELLRFKQMKTKISKKKKEKEIILKDAKLKKEIVPSSRGEEVKSDESDFEEFNGYEEHSNTLSVFELRRLENIKRNREMFDSFEISLAKEEMAPERIKIPKIKKENKEESLPQRSSLRIQKIQSDSKSMFSEDIIQYKERMCMLRVNRIAQVTEASGQSILWHPSETKKIIYCGDEKGCIGIWDVDCVEKGKSVSRFNVHSRSVTSMSYTSFDQSKLYSCSLDGTFSCGDINMSNFKTQFKANFFEKFHHCSIPYQQRNSIFLTSGIGDLLTLDLSTYKITDRFQLCHGSRCPAKCVDCHPIKDFLIVTTSANGTVAIWDSRNIKTSQNDNCLSSFKASEAVVKSFFSPITGKQLLVSSRDGSLNVLNIDDGGMIQLPVKHNINLGVSHGSSTFCATWDPKTDHSFVCSGNSMSKYINLFTCDYLENNMLAYTLKDDKLIYKTSHHLFHPYHDMIGCATFTGRVLIWS